MKLSVVFKSLRSYPAFRVVTGPLQSRAFQPDFIPRDPKSKPVRHKYPAFFDPYSPRPLTLDKIIRLAEQIAALSLEERNLIGPTLRNRLRHPKIQPVLVEGMDLGPQGGSGAGYSKAEEKKVEKTAFEKTAF
ncbi:unnamed protein product [Coffea canephora]|uniref:DH200=94 genomic scaffold, scaffold_249 n=1 Tax=Coffea canephora TaxID=49390 RepID=A0A068VFP9_COFCA|nr:unnamed protein product [Coffea canephora]